jgi:hypothetical protein
LRSGVWLEEVGSNELVGTKIAAAAGAPIRICEYRSRSDIDFDFAHVWRAIGVRAGSSASN